MQAVPSSKSAFRPVWDLPLRLFHWSLLIAVAAAAISGFLLPLTWLNLHLVAGTAIIGLLLFRLVWGFTGSGFSRFSSFLFLPRTVLAHVQALRRGETPHYLGHNPVGSVMIFALLTVLALLGITGTIVLGGAEKQGVLKAIVSYATGSFTRELHELLAYGLLALVLGHVAGIIFESRRSGINLARSMVNGDKPSPVPQSIAPPRIGAAVAGVVAVFLLGGSAAYAMWRLPAAGVPHERNGQVDPHQGAILAEIALLHRVGADLFAQDPAHLVQVRLHVLGVSDVLEGQP